MSIAYLWPLTVNCHDRLITINNNYLGLSFVFFASGNLIKARNLRYKSNGVFLIKQQEIMNVLCEFPRGRRCLKILRNYVFVFVRLFPISRALWNCIELQCLYVHVISAFLEKLLLLCVAGNKSVILNTNKKKHKFLWK